MINILGRFIDFVLSKILRGLQRLHRVPLALITETVEWKNTKLLPLAKDHAEHLRRLDETEETFRKVNAAMDAKRRNTKQTKRA
jgi:hypothetical protein